MNGGREDEQAGRARFDRDGRKPLSGYIACWLRLAASPAFATMAALTGIHDSGAATAICGNGPSQMAWAGMPFMYLLMGIFHLGPWLALLARRHSHDPRAVR